MNSSGWIEHTLDRCNTRGKTGETTKPHYGYEAVSHASHWKAPEVKCIYSSILKPVVTELLVFYGQREGMLHNALRLSEIFILKRRERNKFSIQRIDSLCKIINYEGEILKTNSSKAYSLVFHRFKFYGIELLKVCSLLCRSMDSKEKL